MEYIFIFKKIIKGQTLLRVLMNIGFSKYILSGKIVDIGGGRDPDYFDYFKKENVSTIEVVDFTISGIDLEKDPLPFQDETVDTIVCANVLEHIYNHSFLIREMNRIVKVNGSVVGFVPFLLQYHPDPHDYFRYTKEALVKLFKTAHFSKVTVVEVGGGPFFVNYNNLILSIPVFVKVILFPFYMCMDLIFLKFRPKSRVRYPLGYIFHVHK